MALRIRYFAWLRERMGRAEETWRCRRGSAPWGRWPRGCARATMPGWPPSPTCATVRAAVNQTFAPPPAPVQDGDEVAFFPPVTGG